MGSSSSNLVDQAVDAAFADDEVDGDVLPLSHRGLTRMKEEVLDVLSRRYPDRAYGSVQFFNNKFRDLQGLAQHGRLVPCFSCCRVLNVAGNFLQELPETIGLIQTLETLDAGYNQISTVHRAVLLLPHLKTLILSHNRLTDPDGKGPASLPAVSAAERSCPHALETLDLAGNKFRVIPAHAMLEEMRQLRILSLAANRLEFVDGVEVLSHTLEELDLSRNHIMQLPSAPFTPSQGNTVNLSLTESLRSLQLQHQTELIEEQGVVSRMLGGQEEEDDFEVLPVAIRFNVYHIGRRAVNLSTLNLSSLGLSSRCFLYPDEVVKMEQDPTYTPSEPPDDMLSHMPNLTDLDLSFNQLDRFSTAIPQMSHLRRLSIRNNDFQKIDGVQMLLELEELDAQYNSLIALPVAINDMSKIQRLLLNNNNLKALPYTIMHCSALKELTLGFNSLSMLPEELGLLELESFSFQPNMKLHSPPKEVQAQGSEAMLAWMRSRVARTQLARVNPAYGTGNEDEASEDLAIEMWGSEKTFGTVPIGTRTTLDDLRHLIDLKLDTAPERYQFVLDNCAISTEIEHRELAMLYTPAIQLYDQSSSRRPNFEPCEQVDMEATRELAKVLTAQLKKMKMYKKTTFTPQDGKGAQLFKMPSTVPKAKSSSPERNVSSRHSSTGR